MLSKYAFKEKELFTLEVYKFLKKCHPNTLRISRDLFYTEPQGRSGNADSALGARGAAPLLWQCLGQEPGSHRSGALERRPGQPPPRWPAAWSTCAVVPLCAPSRLCPRARTAPASRFVGLSRCDDQQPRMSPVPGGLVQMSPPSGPSPWLVSFPRLYSPAPRVSPHLRPHPQPRPTAVICHPDSSGGPQPPLSPRLFRVAPSATLTARGA